jgi:glycosyltransferase involved in cell wall biosynthesis
MFARFLTAPLTAIVSVSEFTRRTGDALRATSAPNLVIPNGVGVRPPDPRKGAEFRRRQGIPEGHMVITQVCWMVEKKGVEHMLRAAAMFLRKCSQAHFLLVGDGPELPRYRQLAVDLGIEGAVTFTGLISEPIDMGVFDASDIYCQPSVWQEACPIAVLEAMSARLPVIASDTGGIPEIVEHGRSGILVPVGASEEICAALERLFADPDLRRSMGEAGYQVVLDRHRIDETAQRYASFLLASEPRVEVAG